MIEVVSSLLSLQNRPPAGVYPGRTCSNTWKSDSLPTIKRSYCGPVSPLSMVLVIIKALKLALLNN